MSPSPTTKPGAAVYAITVNDTTLTGDQYTLTAGNINIAALSLLLQVTMRLSAGQRLNDATVTQEYRQDLTGSNRR